MVLGNPMTLRSQIGVGAVGVLGILFILWLLQRRRINESLFYLWLTVFLGILTVGVSNRMQTLLTGLIGAYDPVSSMLLLALGFLFGASLVYSVLISNLNTKLRDVTSYLAELRLDLDEVRAAQAPAAGEAAGEWAGDRRDERVAAGGGR